MQLLSLSRSEWKAWFWHKPRETYLDPTSFGSDPNFRDLIAPKLTGCISINASNTWASTLRRCQMQNYSLEEDAWAVSGKGKCWYAFEMSKKCSATLWTGAGLAVYFHSGTVKLNSLPTSQITNGSCIGSCRGSECTHPFIRLWPLTRSSITLAHV